MVQQRAYKDRSCNNMLSILNTSSLINADAWKTQENAQPFKSDPTTGPQRLYHTQRVGDGDPDGILLGGAEPIKFFCRSA